MDLKKLYTETVENNGSTIDRNGERLTIGAGYLVSRVGYESRVCSALTYNEFVTYLVEYQQLINESVELSGCVVGFWFNSGDNHWYVDVSERIFDRGIAERLGKHRKQIAIYDLQNNEAIQIK